MRIVRAGTSAVLIELDDLDQVIGLHAELRREPPAGTVDLVPAAETLLITFDRSATAHDRVADDVRQRDLATVARPEGRLVEVPVVYDGEDLGDVARMTGMDVRDVVAMHLRPEYQAAFCGFAPGFAYLSGADPALRVPRRERPRTRVPVGAVGLADEFTGVYPREMPGGWQLVGRTDVALWDLDRDPPALLPPGTRVRFVERHP